MSDELMRAVTDLAERLVRLATQDDGLREGLRTLAGAVLAATEGAPSIPALESGRHAADDDEQGETGLDSRGTTTEDQHVVAAGPARPPLPELTLGSARPPGLEHRAELPPPPSASRPPVADVDLSVVEACCRLKAEGVRWAATRRRLIGEGAEFRVEVAPRDREVLDRAGDLGCYLWMNTPDFAVPGEPAPLEDVAGWFDAVADAVALVRGMMPDVETNREFFEPALDVLAEAQSALRVAIERVGGPNDQDQYRVYHWLRGAAAREQIFIRRYMRLDDPADPALLPEIEGRIEALDARSQKVRGQAKKRKSGFSRLRYHSKLIGEGSGGDHDWRKVSEAIDELVGQGVSVSNVEVREVLLPILDKMPDGKEFSQGFNLVLREIDRYLSGRPPTVAPPAAELPTAEVAEVAGLLRGKCALMIGGVPRPEAHQALKAAFGLEDLVWFPTREHGSIDVYESHVARPEVSLVLLAIRWSSHSFGEVKRFCDRHGKPMVRLPGGYGVNQVAAQIVAQCSGQLSSR